MQERFSKRQRGSEESNSGDNLFRVIIAGSRSFANYEMLKANMNRLLQNISDEISIVCGTARGADRLGEKYAKENTDLPEKPDYKAIQEFVMDVNERVVRGLI